MGIYTDAGITIGPWYGQVFSPRTGKEVDGAKLWMKLAPSDLIMPLLAVVAGSPKLLVISSSASGWAWECPRCRLMWRGNGSRACLQPFVDQRKIKLIWVNDGSAVVVCAAVIEVGVPYLNVVLVDSSVDQIGVAAVRISLVGD